MDPRYCMSVRFFPWWSMLTSNQIVGLINMINSVLRHKSSINSLVEIGSHLGESATIFLSFEQIQSIYCIDPWNQNPIYEEVFDNRLEPFLKNNRCKKLKKFSVEASDTFLDNSIDMVYIDGNHEYDYVKDDIKHWYPKVINQGILGGHDYTDDHPGTKKAINEFINEYNLNIQTFVDSSWYVIKE